MTDFDGTAGLASAAHGDQRAWDSLVAQYSGLVWAVARGFRLSPADAADVYQATWLRLVEHLGDIRDGARLGAWLATTCRHEALALIKRARRDVPTLDIGELIAEDRHYGVDTALLAAEEHVALWRAFGRLSGRCQQLLRVVFADPPPTYAEICAALDIPVGSIGPTRARCLTNLQAAMSGADGVTA